jgi:uncharacterized membrane protein YfcA
LIEISLLLLLGGVTGVASSYLGIGGATIMIPAIYQIYPSISAQTVIGSSLCVIFFNSILNTYNFKKSKIHFDKKIFLPLIPTLIVGILVGAEVALYLSDFWLKRIFAIVLFILAIKAIYSKKHKNISEETFYPKHQVSITVGLISGFVTGITGLGGGVILTAFFLIFYKMKPKLVPAYNNLLMIVATFIGGLRYLFEKSDFEFSVPYSDSLQIGHTHWFIILCIFLGSSFTSHFGVKLNHSTSDKTKNNIFVALLIFLSMNMFYKTL